MYVFINIGEAIRLRPALAGLCRTRIATPIFEILSENVASVFIAKPYHALQLLHPMWIKVDFLLIV